jgi:hypothetical protein
MPNRNQNDAVEIRAVRLGVIASASFVHAPLKTEPAPQSTCDCRFRVLKPKRAGQHYNAGSPQTVERTGLRSI